MRNSFQGIPTSEGIAIGRALLFELESLHVPHYAIDESQQDQEVQRFHKALDDTREQVREIVASLSKEGQDLMVDIFKAHLLLLEDKTFIGKVETLIKQNHVNAEHALAHVLAEVTERFKSIKVALLRDRLSDIQDIGKRVLGNLMGSRQPSLHDLVEEEVIIVAHDLSPSDTAQMRKEKVIAFVTDIGGPTSHTAIMARSLEIPAVVGLQDITAHVQSGNQIIVDGMEGIVIVSPSEAVLKKYRAKQQESQLKLADLIHLRDLEAETLDGFKVSLGANIEMQDEVHTAVRYGAEGVGLFRTEFLFLNQISLPSEEQQFEAYRTVAEVAAPHPVVIRTLDVGGDKFVSSPEFPKDMGDSLGCRAIRFSLTHPDLFRAQLRAILRASDYGNVKIMYPMITSVEEVLKANDMLHECMEQLRDEGVPFNEAIEIGTMIEVPSAALMADYLAQEAAFFSIGTNDLIQYTLAVERTNQDMAYLYDPLHPAILRLIHHTVQTAHEAGVPVGVCGEMAGEPGVIPLLLGLGVDSLSMSPISIPMAKKIIRELELSPLRNWVQEILNLPTGQEVRNQIKAYELEFAKKETKPKPHVRR